MSKYSEYVARRKAEHGDKFSDCNLSAQFVAHFNDGSRIKVQSPYPDEPLQTGTVGVTTGWAPCFLLMARSSDHGSSRTLSNRDTIVAVKRLGERKYTPIVATRPLTDRTL